MISLFFLFPVCSFSAQHLCFTERVIVEKEVLFSLLILN